MNLLEIRQLLRTHNYTTTVTLNTNKEAETPTYIINVTFPNIIQHTLKDTVKNYSLILSNNTLTRDGVTISPPSYSLYAHIFSSIISQCQLISYNSLLIDFRLRKRHISELEFDKELRIKLTPEEQLLEEELKELMIMFFLGEEEQDFAQIAKDKGVEDGFNSVINFIST